MRHTKPTGLFALAAVIVMAPLVGSQAPSKTIPLRTGLTIVTAVNWPESGDYESLKRLTDVGERAVTISISSATPRRPSERSRVDVVVLGSALGFADRIVGKAK